MGMKRISLFVVLGIIVAVLAIGVTAEANCGSCVPKVEKAGSEAKSCEGKSATCTEAKKKECKETGKCPLKKKSVSDCTKPCCAKSDEVKLMKSGSESKSACCPKGGKVCDKCAAKKKAKEGSDSKGALKVGDTVENFSLAEAISGDQVSLASLAGSKATVLVFWNQNCPYVKDVEDRVDSFNKKYNKKGVNVVAIDAGINNNSNSIKKHAKGKSFPILVNDDSIIAAHFGATRTPEVFILDDQMAIQYHGAFDSGTYKGGSATKVKTFAEDAVKSILAGENPEVAETKAFGCSLKYAEGVSAWK